MLQFLQSHWEKIVFAVVAVYGAALSTFTFIQNRKKANRTIEVTLSFGAFTYGSHLGDQMIFVKAGNVGEKRVRIEGLGLKLPNDKTVVLMNRPEFDRLPHDLEEGTSCSSGAELETLRKQLKAEGFRGSVKVRPYAFDALGTYFYGKKKSIKTED